MAVKVARFSESPDSCIVYLWTSDHAEWLIVIQKVDAESVIVSVTDYAILYSCFKEFKADTMEWLFADTRPLGPVKVLCAGGRVRLEIKGWGEDHVWLDQCTGPSQLRSLLSTLTSHMFQSARGAGRAEKLSELLAEAKQSDTFQSSSGLSSPVKASSLLPNESDNHSVDLQKKRKPNQSLLNPRVRKPKGSGRQFADDDD